MNLRKNLKGGFTLIELLVVVAIIGILASVVLASLNTARSKAADVAIKAAMANTRAQAAIFYEDHSSSYSLMCTSGTTGGIYPLALNAVQKLSPTAITGSYPSVRYEYSNVGASDVDPNGTGGTYAASVCHTSSSAWAAITSLKNPTLPVGGPYTGGWCVDSTGASKESPSLGINATSCP